jgi:hypothetical protein
LAETPELERLARQRLQLRIQAEELRLQIAREVEALRPVVGWVERGVLVGRSLRSAWPFVGGLAAFVITRKPTRSWWRQAGKLWSFWRIAKKGLQIWQRFRE